LADLERKCKNFLPLSMGRVTFHRADQADADGWPVGLPPPHSVIVNATGMGKDLPGSPLATTAQFPAGAVIWELNYRGERDFLHQAASSPEHLGVRIVDGWELFLLGWTSVLERVFAMKLSDAQTEELSRLAAEAVGRHVPTTLPVAEPSAPRT
jgi:shikimate 5-dehydrogenase